MYCGCKIQIKTKSGEKWSAKVEIPTGAAGGKPYPMEKKFTQEAKLVGMPDSQMKEVIQMINDLENYEIRDLVKLLTVN